jgi:hypothetical protein
MDMCETADPEMPLTYIQRREKVSAAYTVEPKLFSNLLWIALFLTHLVKNLIMNRWLNRLICYDSTSFVQILQWDELGRDGTPYCRNELPYNTGLEAPFVQASQSMHQVANNRTAHKTASEPRFSGSLYLEMVPEVFEIWVVRSFLTIRIPSGWIHSFPTWYARA